MSLLRFCEWLAATEWSVALHESMYMYPLIETLHVLSLFLFVGTVIFVDLRLLGFVFRDVPISEMMARILPWTIGGFVIIAMTGGLLFYAIPVRTYTNIFFRIKLLMIVTAGINMGLFHLRAGRPERTGDNHPVPPFWMRAAGAISLCSWAVVIVMGRMIAYNWFDCDSQPQPEFINWAAGCIIGP